MAEPLRIVSDGAEGALPPAPAPQRRAKRPWKPPAPECAYLRLEDFPHLFQISVTTAWRLAQQGALPCIKVPGTHILRFPRARTERIIASWENGRGRRRVPRRPAPDEVG